jgi:elongation factor G
LLESIAAVTGAVQRKGAVSAGNSLGDAAPEARDRQMSVEVNTLCTPWLDEEFTFLDCPGSIEFLGETLNILPGVDAAVSCSSPTSSGCRMRACPTWSSSTSSTRRAIPCWPCWRC